MRGKSHSAVGESSRQHATDSMTTYSLLTAEQCFERLSTSWSGLDDHQIRERTSTYGANILESAGSLSWQRQLLRSFFFPFNAILFAILLISAMSNVLAQSANNRDYKTIIMLGSMILLSSLIRFWQEYRSSKAIAALRAMIHSTSTVRRNGLDRVEIDNEHLVPGDVLLLAAGDMIPADCRIVQAKDLFLSQSLLSGESLPVEKHAAVMASVQGISAFDCSNLCYMGTTVASGTAIAVVINTGSRCALAEISRSVQENPVESSFDKGVRSVSYLLMRSMLVMVPLVFLINGLTKHDWVESLLFALSVAVGLTPEMLPMIVSTNLARGAVSMAARHVIVKRLSSIQNIGAMDIFCTDKTGTLTMDKIVLKRALNVDGDEDEEVMQWAYLNSFHQTGLRNVMDAAVLEHEQILHREHSETAFVKVDEIPFDFERRRMSVILRQPSGKHLLICKGAVEEMLSVCSAAFDPGVDRKLHIDHDRVTELNDEVRDRIIRLSEQLNEDGLRVLIIAVREFEADQIHYGVSDERSLIVTGFIGFLDPLKDSAAAALKELQKLGVSLKVLSGDNLTICRTICRQVGIPAEDTLLGTDMEFMTDEQLKSRLPHTTLFAKLRPLQKSRIIRLLQQDGHTVGFMGDGINDAAALHLADVGISVDSAVDIAKESAEMILLEKDLLVLKNAVIVGRTTFGNIMKYIKMAASGNFGNMFSMLGASLLLPFVPMLPVQVLLQNLLYDLSQISIPWDRMDDEYMNLPRRWDASDIARFMLRIGPISSIFDYLSFAVLAFVFHVATPEAQHQFQTGWFWEGLISQVLIVHFIRTRRIPFLQSRASAAVLLSGIALCLVALTLPFSALAPYASLQPMPPAYLLCLILILAAYGLSLQWAKKRYIARFGTWL